MIEIVKSFRRILENAPGTNSIFLTDRDGVIVLSVGEELRSRASLVCSLQATQDQTGKLVMGPHLASVFFYENSQLVILNVPPFTVFVVALPTANTGNLLKLREQLKPLLQCVETVIPVLHNHGGISMLIDHCLLKGDAFGEMNIFRSYVALLGMIWQVISRSGARRQIFHYGCRSRHYQHQKSGPRCWDRRILLAFASAAGFSFAEHGIPIERFNKSKLEEEFGGKADEESCWDTLVDEGDLKVYRRLIPGDCGMYEYKCIGTYYDISASLFLDVQNDLAYRKEWDRNVMTLELLKEEDEHELIRWVQKYPYPLHPREYVYTRRTWISDDSRMLVVDSEVVPVHLVPGDSKNIRVATYKSRMAVRSHKEFGDHGLDYILTYSDNPEGNIARPLYNWIINHGGPYFLKQVHEVAREAEQTGRCLKWTSERFQRIRRKKEKKKSSLTSTSTTINLLKDTETNDRDNMDDSELEDAIPMPTKTQKFAFSSLDNIPIDIHLTA